MTSIDGKLVERRLTSLIYRFLDAELYITALFFAERLFAMDGTNHDSRHLLANVMLKLQQPHSALHLATRPQDEPCVGCLFIASQCNERLLRPRKAMEHAANALKIMTTTGAPGHERSQSGCLRAITIATADELFPLLLKLSNPSRACYFCEYMAHWDGSMEIGGSPKHVAQDIPDIAIMYCKAGLLAAKSSLKREAIDHFSSALTLEPLLWEAWLGLCNLGATVKVDELLKPPQNIQSMPSAFPEDGTTSVPPLAALSHPIISQLQRKHQMAPSASAIFANRPALGPSLGPSGSGAGFFTPVQQQAGSSSNLFAAPPPVNRPNQYQLGVLPKATPESYTPSASHATSSSEQQFTPLGVGGGPNVSKLFQIGIPDSSAPKLAKYAGTRRTHSAMDDGGPASKRAKTTAVPERARSAANRQTPSAAASSSSAATRRSTRLLVSNGKNGKLKSGAPGKRPKAGQRSQSISDAEDTQTLSSGSLAHSPRSDSMENLNTGSSSTPETRKNIAIAERYVFDLMKVFARAQYHLSKYECRAVIECLERLPQSQQMAPTVMIMTARAHYELVEYVQAERAFKAARRLDPYRIYDMDLYSTLLWHLRRNAQLSFLAQELLNINSKSAEAWIAVGNCFSLQKEHAQALVCFQRAAEMDPYCAYAYTLSGHESLVTDDVRKATTLFQEALAHDGRHYNAWYGLGSCYLKMGRLPMAQYHFERAVEIHPANAVLLACLGMVHERQNRVEDALSLFNVALVASPDNPLVRYRRAKILVQRGNYAAAEEDLVRLCDLSPSEPNVVLLLGKVLRMQGKTTQASRILAVARDLDPRNAPKIAKLVEETGPIPSAGVGSAGDTTGMSNVNQGERSIEDSAVGVDSPSVSHHERLNSSINTAANQHLESWPGFIPDNGPQRPNCSRFSPLRTVCRRSYTKLNKSISGVANSPPPPSNCNEPTLPLPPWPSQQSTPTKHINSSFSASSETSPSSSFNTSFVHRRTNLDTHPQPSPMFNSGTPAWMSSVSRRKLQSTATPDADKLLRKVLLRNSISRVDLALAEAHSTSSVVSPPLVPTLSSPQQQPIQYHPDPEQHQTPGTSSSNTPLRADEDEFVFPDATSLNTPRVYSTADADAEARWLDSLLEDMSDDDGEYGEASEENITHGDDEEEEEEEDEDGYYLESLAGLLDEPEPIISVPAPISPQEPLVIEARPVDYPLPDDSDDDLSTAPDMDEDVEGESEADSVEWPLTPGQRSITSMLGRSITASTLNQLVASGDGMAPLPLPSIAEGAVFDADVRPAIHEDEPPLYRYSPAPGERPIATSTTALTNSAC